jgi:hypothetical protein
MTNLIAEKTFFYGGKTRRKGDEFAATDAHALMLLRTRQASLNAAPEAASVTKPRRQYRRRDMRAEA